MLGIALAAATIGVQLAAAISDCKRTHRAHPGAGALWPASRRRPAVPRQHRCDGGRGAHLRGTRRAARALRATGPCCPRADPPVNQSSSIASRSPIAGTSSFSTARARDHARRYDRATRAERRGKTTIAALVLRLADPTIGAVRCGGVDLRESSSRLARAARLGAPARADLRRDAPREHRPRAPSSRRQIRARRRAGSRLLSSLRMASRRLLGEGGRVSSPSAQRVALARAFVPSPRGGPRRATALDGSPRAPSSSLIQLAHGDFADRHPRRQACRTGRAHAEARCSALAGEFVSDAVRSLRERRTPVRQNAGGSSSRCCSLRRRRCRDGVMICLRLL